MDTNVLIIIILVFVVLGFWALRSGNGKAMIEILKTKMSFERKSPKISPKVETKNEFVAGPGSSGKDVSQEISTSGEGSHINKATLEEKSKIKGLKQKSKSE